jgi:hypothetical protein
MKMKEIAAIFGATLSSISIRAPIVKVMVKWYIREAMLQCPYDYEKGK